jgi:hypothetical protein
MQIFSLLGSVYLVMVLITLGHHSPAKSQLHLEGVAALLRLRAARISRKHMPPTSTSVTSVARVMPRTENSPLSTAFSQASQ